MLQAYSPFSGVTLTVNYTGGGGSNQPPVSVFSYAASNLSVSFTDASSDADGSIASLSWDFGDGGSSTAINPSHTYVSAGSYTVALTVTDNLAAVVPSWSLRRWNCNQKSSLFSMLLVMNQKSTLRSAYPAPLMASEVSTDELV